MPKKKDIDFNKYKDLATASKFGVKKRVNNIINLYSERKIYNIKTALNLLNQLTDKRKKRGENKKKTRRFRGTEV